MRLNKKIFKVLFVIIILLNLCTLEVKATDSVMQGADDFLNKGNKSILNSASIKGTSDTLFNMFSAVGVAIVLVVGAILGIQFMMGSIEEKVKIKEALIPYVVGTVVIFGAVGIWSLVLNVLNGAFL